MTDRLPPPLTLAEFGERVRCLACSPFWRISVTSGGRDEIRNKKVGGSEKSYHRWSRGGLAADLVVEFNFDWVLKESSTERGPMEVFLQQCWLWGLDAIDEGDHVHVEPADE